MQQQRPAGHCLSLILVPIPNCGWRWTSAGMGDSHTTQCLLVRLAETNAIASTVSGTAGCQKRCATRSRRIPADAFKMSSDKSSCACLSPRWKTDKSRKEGWTMGRRRELWYTLYLWRTPAFRASAIIKAVASGAIDTILAVQPRRFWLKNEVSMVVESIVILSLMSKRSCYKATIMVQLISMHRHGLLRLTRKNSGSRRSSSLWPSKGWMPVYTMLRRLFLRRANGCSAMKLSKHGMMRARLMSIMALSGSRASLVAASPRSWRVRWLGRKGCGLVSGLSRVTFSTLVRLTA